MTTRFDRQQAKDAVEEARNHAGTFPLTEGDAVRVTRLADQLVLALAEVERQVAQIQKARDWYESVGDADADIRWFSQEGATFEPTTNSFRRLGKP